MKKLLNLFKRKQKKHTALSPSLPEPVILTRDKHPISRKSISKNALKVLYHLQSAGFSAYLVGGCVRDMMLGREPKDFDVATNARPEEVRRIFRNCRLIGRRFRLAHIYFKNEIIEVATFRASAEKLDAKNHHNYHGMVIHDNIYGTLEDDVWRRDFTVNSLYYNIADFSVVDYAGGVADLSLETIKIIGNPEARFREDPVRMLRAVRFASKLSFTIDPETAKPITALAPLLQYISNARLFDETLKLFFSGHSASTFTQLRHFELFQVFFPLTNECLNHQDLHQMTDIFIMTMLNNTDNRILENQPVNPAFLYASFLWYPLQLKIKALKQEGIKYYQTFERACDEIIIRQVTHTALPRKFSNIIREIWSLQRHFITRQGRRPFKLLASAHFRLAYDFLLLRAVAELDLIPIAAWWTQFIDSTPAQQEKMMLQLRRKKHQPKEDHE